MFDAFLEDMGERPEGSSLDRIDNNGPYSPKNCRWANAVTQQNNQRTTVTVTYGGRKIALSDLARELGLSKKTLEYRVAKGWPESDWSLKAWGGHRH